MGVLVGGTGVFVELFVRVGEAEGVAVSVDDEVGVVESVGVKLLVGGIGRIGTVFIGVLVRVKVNVLVGGTGVLLLVLVAVLVRVAVFVP